MRHVLGLCALVIFSVAVSSSAQVDPTLLGGMKWRQIGPFRGGRVLAVAGVPGDPNTYYFGGVAGGVFKSTNARPELDADLQSRGRFLHRGHRSRGFRSQCHLRRKWRSLHPRQHLLW